VILAQIGVGQHIVADALCLAQPAAVADHQPAIGAQHGEMVGDGLGVGGADPDVDQRGAAFAVGAGEVIGRHLEAVPGAVIDDLQRLRFAHATADGKPARQVQRS
jgi:hypothetical protein